MLLHNNNVLMKLLYSQKFEINDEDALLAGMQVPLPRKQALPNRGQGRRARRQVPLDRDLVLLGHGQATISRDLLRMRIVFVIRLGHVALLVCKKIQPNHDQLGPQSRDGSLHDKRDLPDRKGLEPRV